MYQQQGQELIFSRNFSESAHPTLNHSKSFKDTAHTIKTTEFKAASISKTIGYDK